MAFCSNCGAHLDGAKKFCTSCGQAVQTAEQPTQAAQPQPVPQPSYKPQPTAKKKSKAPIIIIVVLLIAALAAAAFFTNGFGLFGGGDTPSGDGGNIQGGNNQGNNDGGNNNGGDGGNIQGGNNQGNNEGENSGGNQSGNSPGNTPLPLSNEWIALNKTNFAPGELIVVTVKGITQQMVDDWACIGVFNKDLSKNIGGYGELGQVGENVTEFFEAPADHGEYAVVLLKKWHQNGEFDELFVASLAFTVGMELQGGNNGDTENNGENSGGNTGGGNSGEAIGYPAEWTNDVPKMSGTVVRSFAMAENPRDGYQVVLGNKNIDDVYGYIETLKNNGYIYNSAKDVEIPYDEVNYTFATTYRNGTWMVGITYTGGNSEAVVFFMKDES